MRGDAALWMRVGGFGGGGWIGLGGGPEAAAAAGGGVALIEIMIIAVSKLRSFL